MFQTGTYWPPVELNGYGQPRPGNWPKPQVIKCRYEQRVEVIRGREEREFTSNAQVYPDRILDRGGWFAPGDHSDVSDPYDVAEQIDAQEIVDVRCVPSPLNDEQEVKVWL